jgi:hypothetical protein
MLCGVNFLVSYGCFAERACAAATLPTKHAYCPFSTYAMHIVPNSHTLGMNALRVVPAWGTRGLLLSPIVRGELTRGGRHVVAGGLVCLQRADGTECGTERLRCAAPQPSSVPHSVQQVLAYYSMSVLEAAVHRSRALLRGCALLEGRWHVLPHTTAYTSIVGAVACRVQIGCSCLFKNWYCTASIAVPGSPTAETVCECLEVWKLG